MEKLRPLLAGVADGYALSLRRVERVLPQFGLEPIGCVGVGVRPGVDGSGRGGGRLGPAQRHGGRGGPPRVSVGREAFRSAQVKVAR